MLTLAFSIAAWVLILPFGYFALREGSRAHDIIDTGRMRNARVPMMRALGLTLLVIVYDGQLYAIRYLITPLVYPAVTGSVLVALSLTLIGRAWYRHAVE